MTIAAQIDPVLAARQAKALSRDAERATRDAFIQAQFAVLGARFEALLREALGLHSLFTLAVTPVSYAVQNRTFSVLNLNAWSIMATFNGVPQTVSFAPRLDFREPDQFGLVECAIDFAYAPLRSRGDAIAQVLLERGVQLRGKTAAGLVLPLADGPVALRAADLEDALRVWWLRP